jgi:hypothetical protein
LVTLLPDQEIKIKSDAGQKTASFGLPFFILQISGFTLAKSSIGTILLFLKHPSKRLRFFRY